MTLITALFDVSYVQKCGSIYSFAAHFVSVIIVMHWCGKYCHSGTTECQLQLNCKWSQVWWWKYLLMVTCVQRWSYLLRLLPVCVTCQHRRSRLQHRWIVYCKCVHHGQRSQSEAGSRRCCQVGPCLIVAAAVSFTALCAPCGSHGYK